MTDRTRTWSAVLIVLFLAIFVAPLVYLAGSALAGTLRGGETSGDMLVILAGYPEGPFQLLQKAVMPLAAALTIPALWERKRGHGPILIGVCLVGLLASGILWFHLQNPDHAANVRSLSEVGVLKRAEPFRIATNQYLLGAFESLITYALVFLGVTKVAAGPRKGKEAHDAPEKATG